MHMSIHLLFFGRLLILYFWIGLLLTTDYLMSYQIIEVLEKPINREIYRYIIKGCSGLLLL